MWNTVAISSVLLIFAGISTVECREIPISELLVICKGQPAEKIEGCILQLLEGNSYRLLEAIPEAALPVLDPSEIGSVHIKTKSDNIKLDIQVSDVKWKGLSNVEPKQLLVDHKNKKFHGVVYLPIFRHSGNYILKADLGELVLDGKGTYWMIMDDLTGTLDTDLDVITVDGKPRVQIKNTKWSFTVPDVSMRFNNLFNGDDTLDNAANAVLMENRMELLELVREGLDDIIGKFIERTANKALLTFDIDDMGGADDLKRAFNLS